MAELVALLASIGGLATTAGAALKLADFMFRTARRIHTAKEDIEDFGRDINNFANIIFFALRTLNRYKAHASRSSAVEHLQTRNILDSLVDQSRRVVKSIQILKRPIRSLDDGPSFWAHIKWALKSRDVKAIGPKIESVKSSLSLVISILSLEEAQNGSDAEEILHLRKQIKTQLQTIKMLKTREARETGRLTTPGRFENPHHQSAQGYSGQSVQDLLVNLGESMRDTGRVPEAVTRLSSRSTLRSEQSHFTNSMNEAASEDTPETEPTSAKASETSLGSLPYNAHSNHPLNSSGSENVRNFLLRERVEREELESESLRTVSIQSNPKVSYSKQHKLTFNRKPYASMGQADGFISLKGKNSRVQAELDYSLEHNLVSRAYVRDLGLDDIEEVDSVELLIDGEAYISARIVTFEWGQTRENLRESPIRVHCYVFEEGVDNMVLGLEFLQQRRTHEFKKRVDL